MNLSDYYAITPLVFLVCWAIFLLLVDLWIPAGRKGITALLSAAGLLIALVLVLRSGEQVLTAFEGSVVVDGFSVFLSVLFLVSALAGIALAHDYLQRLGLERGEYYPLLLISTSGMMLMTYAYDLIEVFLALELLSIPLYILAGFSRLNLESEEASLKYFLLGAFSSGFVLYGVGLVFAATGYTDFPGIAKAAQNGSLNPTLFLIGAGLVLTGFGFKSALVPFHMWSPDVYQGAPSPVTAFMSVGAKAAGFAALLRVFVVVFPGMSVNLTPLLWALAALTMFVGNIVALVQSNIKRLLAYSSIAHSGYLLMAFVPYGNASVRSDAIAGMLFYLAAYCLTTFGAWAVVIALEKAEGKGLELEDYAGLGHRYPFLAATMTIFLLSFTGVPLTLGFWGKFYLFSTAVEGGFWQLALIGLLTSLISAYYYLRVVVIMYMRPGTPQVQRNFWPLLTSGVGALAVVILGIAPGVLLNLAVSALLKGL
ncbi:MAG: NADH-quinone oxidoreductase subunit N [Anaerolineae bacterium]|nr:NADH-quinone oxidoreductase subunit N [Anaerolineae bacterium]